ncbi:MAG: transcription factor iws1 [Lasallia pustulata]|uniref:Transcription factor iws1 n=1 Tax=Lasallia pustulata TaxID=136370 RepID=A0A5M8PM74_9LECA|nr:MAG: transcription factor iws1 [Lasallia pustulata]
MSSASDSRPVTPLPEAGHDPADPNQPLYEDHDTPSAPIGNPTADMDEDLSDSDILSDVDEAQFEDFDPANVAIDDRPAIAVDEDNVKLLGRHKRKRDGEGEVEGGKKKKKEGKRDKPKKLRKKRDEDDNFSGGEELEGKRVRKKKAEGAEGVRKEKVRPRKATPEDEERLDPEERRRRALDRAMDAALKNPNKRRRRADGVGLNSMADDEIASLRIRMAEAAEADVLARSSTPARPAMHKLRMLPEVTALLNRNSRDIENAIVEPENNLLESVRFFLEPLNDGSLPAYNIQRELFASLAKLPISKEALVSSGIGKVVLFYTKSKKPELGIKRQAERLLGEWTRPILNRSDDYRKRVLESADYDPSRLPHRPVPNGSQLSQAGVATETAAQARERALAPPVRNANRARVESAVKSYSIVPRSMGAGGGQFARPLGASGEDAFRRMKARQMAQAGRGEE